MVYVSGDGTVGGSKSIGRWFSDLFAAIYSFFALFFSSIMNPPTISASSSNRTYAQRNGGRSHNYGGGNSGNRLGRGSNVRGVGSLQSNAEARMGGG
ncbi:expressed unknown protein [Seminavis robusta]|uniref:Glycine-rich protein n=1 Tax=Seminavis robusta TaxID=568900 RepID=A0A9N8HW68_9STRA|nr:expressed unknown protein [Seminavis robusta]|eukprot:Sro1925_g305800.1 n/a (97) ;mRNA; f:11159-11540